MWELLENPIELGIVFGFFFIWILEDPFSSSQNGTFKTESFQKTVFSIPKKERNFLAYRKIRVF